MISSPAMSSPDVFTDINGLNKISNNDNSTEGLRDVAKKFESMFLHMVLKSMREANKVFAEGSYFNSFETDFHQQMLDSQLSISLTEGQGVGLADVLFRQMQMQYDPASRQQAVTLRSNLSMSASPPKKSVSEQASGVVNPDSLSFDSPDDFAQAVLPQLRSAAEDVGLDPKALLAQAALETGWGKRVMSDSHGRPAYNLFGIKADDRWEGPAVSVTTLEYEQGSARRQTASFRAYDSFADSATDYVQFLRDNPRYNDALKSTANAEQYWTELQKAGYATDPAYAAKLSSLYSGKTLARLDAVVTPSSSQPGVVQAAKEPSKEVRN